MGYNIFWVFFFFQKIFGTSQAKNWQREKNLIFLIFWIWFSLFRHFFNFWWFCCFFFFGYFLIFLIFRIIFQHLHFDFCTVFIYCKIVNLWILCPGISSTGHPRPILPYRPSPNPWRPFRRRPWGRGGFTRQLENSKRAQITPPKFHTSKGVRKNEESFLTIINYNYWLTFLELWLLDLAKLDLKLAKVALSGTGQSKNWRK